jgi:subtilisin family serine protease
VSAGIGSARKRVSEVARRGRGVAAGLAAVAFVLALPVVGLSQPAAGDTGRSEPSRTVTLITGDHVTLRGNAIAVQRASGRPQMVFEHYRERGHHYVIPADASRLINRGRLDRRLFDVTGLLELGYGDAARDNLPLIAVHERRALPALRAGESEVTRRLPALDMTALRADKEDATDFWTTITRTTGVASIWLDGRRQLELDASVPQIGTPAAWAAGFTGAGMTAAVLDSGIDLDHPDFAGRIVEARNFTVAPDASDTYGHGTHVASILAGSGAASGGTYRGVAPDAELLVGKVCPANSCPESAILAGMSWAAQAGADVINMSLSGPDTPGLDPIEQAVNDLTATTGTLFVTAAGNDGTSAPVGTPATADAALAVGAVDRDDTVAEFSSRGPRVGDMAIKPDLTAPGVEIVAARASDGFIGDPVDDFYARLSGTSMATPHAAGAAVLLAQQHPTWTPAQLKAALMGSAQPNPSFTVFDQGAGRLDVARAIEQEVISTPTSVALGLQPFPHEDDEVLTRVVTYNNLGASPVVLEPGFDVTGPDGLPAPAGMFDVEPDIVTVPAGGEAAVTLTADTRVPGALGLYSGALVATGEGVRVRTPLAVDKEAERYNLTIRHLDRRGVVPVSYTTHVQGLDSAIGGPQFDPDGDGSLTVRLPAGRYHLYSVINTPIGDQELLDASALAQPLFELTQDTEVVLDARPAKPMRVRVPEKSAESAAAVVLYERRGPETFVGALFAPNLEHLYTAHLGAAVPEDEVVSSVHSQWGKPGPAGIFADSPYAYHLVWFERGRYFTGFDRNVRRDDLAVVRGEYRTPMPGRVGHVAAGAFPLDGDIGGSAFFFQFRLPFQRTEYYIADDARWQTEFQTVEPESGVFETVHLKPLFRLKEGRTSEEVWGRAVYGPAFPEVEGSPSQWIFRHHGGGTGETSIGTAQDTDGIAVSVPVYNDFSEDHQGFSREDTGRTALYLNGELIGESERSGLGDFGVPDAEGEYRVEISGARPSFAEVSTEVSATWTFRSRHVPDSVFTPLPVMAIRFGPDLDEQHSAPAGQAFTLPLRVERQALAPAAQLRELKLEVSYDDGATWQPAPLTGTGESRRTLLLHPAEARFVSLRAAAADGAGNSVEQTILRAYRLRPR